MKKITVKQYAEALYQATKDKSGEVLSVTLKNFVKLLVKNKNLKLANRIVDRFSQFYNEQENCEEVEVITSRRLEENVYQQISAWLKKDLDREIHLIKKVDPALLAGFKVKYQDTILDACLQTRLAKFKENLSA